MSFDLFQEIIDEASEYGPRSFSFHLFGEPLLYPYFFQAVEYTKKSNPKNTVIITSNGTLFNRYVDGIISSGIDKLIWSWRPEAKFSKETKERLRRWGKLTVRMIRGVTPQSALDEWGRWPNREVRELHNYGANIDLLQFVAKKQFSTTAKNVDSKRWPCYHLWLAPAVAWNGNLLICCSDPHQKEILGRFPEMSVAQAWQKISTIREAHLRGEYSGICKDCDVWKTYPDLFFGFQKKRA